MRLALALLAALAVSGTGSVRAVRVTTLDFRTAVRVLTTDNVPGAMVVREGDEVVIRIPAAPEGALPTPAVEAPITGLRVEVQEGVTLVRVKVAPEVPFELSQEPGMTTVVFGEAPAPELRGPVTPELYAQLFPSGVLAKERGGRGNREAGGGQRVRGRARGGSRDAAALRHRRATSTRTSSPSTTRRPCASATCRSRPA